MSLPADRYAVLDPGCSAVVEACAGSGKTWLLAARIVRLLLAGAQPAEILAITFTRKAAREIEERVVDWLRFIATAPEADAVAFLTERGAPGDAATLTRARGLYERVTGALPGLAVNTFHGWFLQLLAVAPLSANLAGTTLAEEGSRQFDELWQTFAARLQGEPQGVAAQAFVRLLESIGQNAVRMLVRKGMMRRAEWLALAGEGADATVTQLDALRQRLGVGEPGAALATFFTAGWASEFRAYLGCLEASDLDTDRKLGQRLADALNGAGNEPTLRGIAGVLLTDKGSLRVRKPTKTLDQRFGAEGAARFLDLHARLGLRVQEALAALQEERNFAFNCDALTVHQDFLAHLAAFKAERRQIDFVDAEWRVLQLLSDESSAAFIQARLDARYRHVLLDEFQDTNPLQWQILLAWLGAYTDAARPTVFLVGDPKQSIYRFRRAEPRLFATASAFLQEQFGAIFQARDETRRNALAIIDVVNALFTDETTFQPFRTQTAHAADLPGRVELLPLCVAAEVEMAEDADAKTISGLRDPLRQPAVEATDSRRQQEAAQLAERLSTMLGRTLIREGQGSAAISRPLRPGDVLLLVRTRTNIAIYEQALAAAGIPFSAASRGGLLDSLEVSDTVALLEFLVTPAADLQLAHALKSPLLACRDEDLLLLAARTETGWWPRLQAAASELDVTAPVARAARLIGAWIAAAATLPAHDLLDRIYNEGEVMARYRLAVPEARRAAALANLEALLLLALDLDGGRYPSLPRFIDELKQLRRAEGDDAPDEGELAADETLAADGRVRIMTIHGAKGLEAPLVWLLDANATPRGDGPWEALVEWQPGDPAPTHFSFVGRKEERGRARAALFEAEAAAASREELNLLYVAVTRAKQLFLASGIANDRVSVTTPHVRLQAALAKLGDLPWHGEALLEVARDATPPAPAAIAAEVPIPAVGERRQAPDAAARFGILLHAILEHRVPGHEGTVCDRGNPWWQALGYSDGELANAMPIAERLLAAPALRRFFDPACYRKAWNEVEFADANGDLFRIDRLVEGDEAVWVLDYKSSGKDTSFLPEYCRQVEGYCSAVGKVFTGRRVEGLLVFSDASLLCVCSLG